MSLWSEYNLLKMMESDSLLAHGGRTKYQARLVCVLSQSSCPPLSVLLLSRAICAPWHVFHSQ